MEMFRTFGYGKGVLRNFTDKQKYKKTESTKSAHKKNFHGGIGFGVIGCSDEIQKWMISQKVMTDSAYSLRDFDGDSCSFGSLFVNL